MRWLLIGTIVLFTCLLLVAEQRRSQRGKALTKPIASLAFVLLAVSEGAQNVGSYGRWILLGLTLAAVGDVLLIPKATLSFLLGIVSFLLGHLAFLVAFLQRGLSLSAFVTTLLPIVLVGGLVMRWVWPYAGTLRPAVAVYVAVISLMVPAAVSTSLLSGNPWIAMGAIAFYLSDLSVARDRFVHEAFINRAWGLPLYYFAEVCLALSVAHP